MLPKLQRFSVRSRQRMQSGVAVIALVACCLGEMTSGLAAPASASRDDKSLPSAEDGFTRESLMEFDAPAEPAPFAPAPTASLDAGSDEARASRVAARRRRRLLRHPSAQTPPPIVVVKVAKHRNPAESFVYWWNGWVIRNFHTKVGTVLLGTVGAQT